MKDYSASLITNSTTKKTIKAFSPSQNDQNESQTSQAHPCTPSSKAEGSKPEAKEAAPPPTHSYKEHTS